MPVSPYRSAPLLSHWYGFPNYFDSCWGGVGMDGVIEGGGGGGMSVGRLK